MGKRHRNGRRKRRRKSESKKRKITLFGGIVAALLVLLFSAGMFYRTWQRQKSLHVETGESTQVGSEYRYLLYNGEKYQYNNRITNILYAGIDSTGEMKETSKYGYAARADSINLLVLDEENHRMTVFLINRDTMTEVRKYALDGFDLGKSESHLALAYTYGNGGKKSCENLVEAVSDLFAGIPIQHYVITNRDSLEKMGEFVEGLTVTVPNDDLAEKYPDMVTGAQVQLGKENLTDYLRYRKTEQDFSNEGRMQRQCSFIEAFMKEVQEDVSEDAESIWEQFEKMKACLQTSISRNQYLDLVNGVQKISFEEKQLLSIEGEGRLGEKNDEFYVDQSAFWEQLIEVFYEKI